MKAKKKHERCQEHDHSLKELARTKIRPPNKFICICVHCHERAKPGEPLVHGKNCCWRKSAT